MSNTLQSSLRKRIDKIRNRMKVTKDSILSLARFAPVVCSSYLLLASFFTQLFSLPNLSNNLNEVVDIYDYTNGVTQWNLDIQGNTRTFTISLDNSSSKRPYFDLAISKDESWKLKNYSITPQHLDIDTTSLNNFPSFIIGLRQNSTNATLKVIFEANDPFPIQSLFIPFWKSDYQLLINYHSQYFDSGVNTKNRILLPLSTFSDVKFIFPSPSFTYHTSGMREFYFDNLTSPTSIFIETEKGILPIVSLILFLLSLFELSRFLHKHR